MLEVKYQRLNNARWLPNSYNFKFTQLFEQDQGQQLHNFLRLHIFFSMEILEISFKRSL